MSDIDIPGSVNAELFQRACDTEGYFTLDEARCLIGTVQEAPVDASLLEIGSFHGRSTLFFASAMSESQQLLAVDAFLTPGSYSGHSFKTLTNNLRGTRTTVFPMTLAQAFPHLRHRDFDVILVDADHSLLGFTQDVCLSIELLKRGGVLLCHDVADWFPAIPAFLDLLVRRGVLETVERRRTLGKFIVKDRPSWLTRAKPISGTPAQLPGSQPDLIVP